jgi:hypothetical protein
MQMWIRKVRKIDCRGLFPATAVSAQIRVSNIEPASSAVLIYTPKTAEPIRFSGPETTLDVPVEGQEMWVQPVLGNTSFRLKCLGSREPSGLAELYRLFDRGRA